MGKYSLFFASYQQAEFVLISQFRRCKLKGEKQIRQSESAYFLLHKTIEHLFHDIVQICAAISEDSIIFPVNNQKWEKTSSFVRGKFSLSTSFYLCSAHAEHASFCVDFIQSRVLGPRLVQRWAAQWQRRVRQLHHSAVKLAGRKMENRVPKSSYS
jgi:hypothetical protein